MNAVFHRRVGRQIGLGAVRERGAQLVKQRELRAGNGSRPFLDDDLEMFALGKLRERGLALRNPLGQRARPTGMVAKGSEIDGDKLGERGRRIKVMKEIARLALGTQRACEIDAFETRLQRLLNCFGKASQELRKFFGRAFDSERKNAARELVFSMALTTVRNEASSSCIP